MLTAARFETGRWAKPVFRLREKLRIAAWGESGVGRAVLATWDSGIVLSTLRRAAAGLADEYEGDRICEL